MRRKLAVMLAAGAIALVPAAAPAQAEETHVCDIFTPPVGTACDTALRIFCMLTRDNPVCR